ncbi:MAG: DNA polymerase III subunit gamma/tau [Bdellovibrionales bacterium]|nr:DNA polymerase III subunit gamma/tau [Bdellovibrionales bacterium]
MAYQVIARKWRPGTFAQLIGQEHISTTLINSLRRGRLHHALLFTGPRGTGKTSTARILAKALCCPNAKDFVPCQKCSDCEEISSGRNINVIEIDGASNNGVDAIRELRNTVAYMPTSGQSKLYIIDEVHMLSTSAFNALLKTLEEPPDHVTFIMATTEAHKIPETVLSRVQRFDFRTIPTRLIVESLQKICENENIIFENAALWAIARQGAGSMRDSQSFLDQAIAFTDGQLLLTKVSEVLGLTDRKLLLTTLKALVNRTPQEALTCLEQISIAGYDPRLFLQDLLAQIRHLLMLKLLPPDSGPSHNVPQNIDLAESEINDLRELSGSLSGEDIHLLFDMALKGLRDLNQAPDAHIALEMVLLRMSAAPYVRQLADWGSVPLMDNNQTTAKTVLIPLPGQNTRQNKSSDLPSPSEKSEAVKETHGGTEAWQELVQKINAVNSLIGAQLENCFLHELTEKRIVLGVNGKMKFLFEKINSPDFKKKLSNYITTFWGPGYSIEVQPINQTATENSQLSVAQQNKLNQEASIENLKLRAEKFPFVQSMQSVFKTEIKSVQKINQNQIEEI